MLLKIGNQRLMSFNLVPGPTHPKASFHWPVHLKTFPRQVGREVARQLSGGGSVEVATFEEVVQTLKKVEETQERDPNLLIRFSDEFALIMFIYVWSLFVFHAVCFFSIFGFFLETCILGVEDVLPAFQLAQDREVDGETTTPLTLLKRLNAYRSWVLVFKFFVSSRKSQVVVYC